MEYKFILNTEYEELKKYKLKCEALVRQIQRMQIHRINDPHMPPQKVNIEKIPKLSPTLGKITSPLL